LAVVLTGNEIDKNDNSKRRTCVEMESKREREREREELNDKKNESEFDGAGLDLSVWDI
jgi:hypothetical protein